MVSDKINQERMSILFVSIPFSDTVSEEQQRSLFFWKCIFRNYDADLLLVKTPEYLTKPVPEVSGYEQVYSIVTAQANPLQAQQVYHFSKDNRDKFSQILLSKRFDLVFLQGENCGELAQIAEKIQPGSRIIIDIDKLLSEREQDLILQNPDRKNRLHQLEFMKLKQMEKVLFRQSYHFIFSSKTMFSKALEISGLKGKDVNYIVLPNPLPDIPSVTIAGTSSASDGTLLKDKFLLFYGDLGTDANLDAFLYLTKEIYPRVSKTLQQKDVKIYVVGSNPQRIHEQLCGGRIKLLGLVENLPAYIKAAQFVILPLRKTASDNRILESAQLGKAVLTTPTGIGASYFSPGMLAIEENIDAYCTRLTKMILNPMETREMGQQLSDEAQQKFSRDNIEQQLITNLNAYLGRIFVQTSRDKLRIALMSGAYLDEKNYESSPLYRIARQLALTCNVTLLCPSQKSKANPETRDGITIVRFKDIMQYKLPFLKDWKVILSPGILPFLLKNDFDLIHCWPGISLNYRPAFLVSKIKEIPLLLSLESDIEYLIDAPLNPVKKLMLRHSDCLFTFTEKNYNYLRQFNERVEQIPVPVEIPELKQEIPSVRQKHGLDNDTFVYLCLGDLTSANGQDIALKAFTQALPSLTNARLVVVGNNTTDPDFWEDLEVCVTRDSLQEDVLFTGELDRSEVAAWIAAADLLVIPARKLRFGREILFSWACHTPVLQSDAVDPNLVIDGYNGYLFRSEDVDDLSQQMQSAFTHRNNLLELAEHGVELVTSKHTLSYVVERYLIAYKQLTL
jgi:glycosyltransferase involved in cell wall biosynthesis